MKTYQKAKEKMLSAHWLAVNDPDKFQKEFARPSYMKDGFIMNSKEGLNILKRQSEEIQSANKFYIDFSNSNVAENLTEKEMRTVARDIKIFLPYEKTFIQFENEDIIHNIWFKVNTTWKRKKVFNWIEDKIGFGGSLPRKKKSNYLMFQSVYYKLNAFEDTLGRSMGDRTLIDPTLYVIEPDQEHWQEGKRTVHFGWGTFPEFDVLHEGGYQGGTKNYKDLEEHTVKVLFLLNLLLSYPALSSTKTIKGKTGIHMVGTHGYKASHLMQRPTWEHKILKLDLYGKASGGHSGNGSPKAFHSVRGHLRRLAKGNITFVKPHFRGSKEVGIVEKEYSILK
jgi:hypothetical protein